MIHNVNLFILLKYYLQNVKIKVGINRSSYDRIKQK